MNLIMIDKEKKNNLQLFEDWLSIKYPNVKIDDIFTDDDIVPKDPYYQKYLDDPEVNHSYDYYLIENGQLTCNQNVILTGWSYEDKIDLISDLFSLFKMSDEDIEQAKKKRHEEEDLSSVNF